MTRRTLNITLFAAMVGSATAAIAQMPPQPQPSTAPAVTSPTTPPAVMPGSPAPAMKKVKLDAQSKQFLTKAIEGNFAEVALGQLGSTKGTSEAVKAYGTMLTTDHGAANDKAIAAANMVGVTAPTQANAKQQKMYDNLAKLSGPQFDAAYAKHMVADHKMDVRDYKRASTLKTAEVAAYARQILPTLQKHLTQANELVRAKPVQQSAIR